MPRILSALLLLIAITFVNGTSRFRRLAGGMDAQINQVPYMVAIRYKNALVCGGAIISPTKILTAANCVDNCLRSKTPNLADCKASLSITGGSTSLSKSGNVYKVKSVKVPQNFVLGKFANDIGIITLETPIKFSSTEQPIALPDKDITENSVATASGWGARNEKERNSDILQSLKEKVLPHDKCNDLKLLKDARSNILTVDVNDFCGFPIDSPKAGLCVGDSGNPLVQDGKIIGVSTWGIGCALGYPDIYTNVFRNLNFIKEELKAN